MDLPASLLQSLQSIPGYDADAFQVVHSSGKQIVSIRINEQKISKASFLNVWDAPCSLHPVPWCSSGFYLSERPSFTLDPLFHAGAYYVQEASSMLLEQAMQQKADLSRPLVVIDLCAAPGGKSTLLQSLIHRDSLLISNEVIQSRVSVLRENVIKWGGGNVLVTHNDPRDFKQLSGFADVLVVDAPCSGSGLFRRDPAAMEEWSLPNVEHCSQRQQRILADAWDCLKTGGLLIYSTCSYSEAENEAIANWLTQEMHAVPHRLTMDPSWGISETISSIGTYGYRCWPDKVQGEGFFLAVFRKEDHQDTHSLRIKKKLSLPVRQKNIAAAWIKQSEEIDFVLQGTQMAAVPKKHVETIHLLMEQLRVRYAGVELGTIAKDDLLPSHALALSDLVSDTVQSITLNKEQALQYLRKQNFDLHIEQKGWIRVMYQGLSLGWLKSLGNRFNNYYPKEYRILK